MKALTGKFDTIIWLGIILITLMMIPAQDHMGWMKAYPKALIVPFDSWLNAIMDVMIAYLGWLFRGNILDSGMADQGCTLGIASPALDGNKLSGLFGCLYRRRVAAGFVCACFLPLYGGDWLLVGEYEHPLACRDFGTDGRGGRVWFRHLGVQFAAG